ncbi:MAG: hypothetical protein Fur0014_04050 [Rubrivivax sp.]
MWHRRFFLAWALALVSSFAGAAGDAVRANALPAAYSKLVVFGDGLSDGGFFGRLTGNRYPPSPPFLGGRWTNGPTWVEVLAAQSGWPLAAKDNHAQGGATTGRFNINEPLRGALGIPADVPIIGVLAQIERAAATPGAIDPQALHVVWAGGHDIGAYLDHGQPDLRAQPPAENIRAGLKQLQQAGARHVLLETLPDLGATPAYAGTPKAAEASRLTRDYNVGLARVAAEFRAAGLNVTLLDGGAAFARAGRLAPSLGIKVFDQAYLPDDYIDFSQPLAPAKPLPAGRDAGDYFSFWAVAASAKVHGVIAQAALETLAAARADQRFVRQITLPGAAYHPLHDGPGRVAFIATSPAGVPHVARIELKAGDVQAPYASEDGKARLATVLRGTVAIGEGTAVDPKRERRYQAGDSFVIPPRGAVLGRRAQGRQHGADHGAAGRRRDRRAAALTTSRSSEGHTDEDRFSGLRQRRRTAGRPPAACGPRGHAGGPLGGRRVRAAGPRAQRGLAGRRTDGRGGGGGDRVPGHALPGQRQRAAATGRGTRRQGAGGLHQPGRTGAVARAGQQAVGVGRGAGPGAPGARGQGLLDLRLREPGRQPLPRR